jgi:putative pyruvate formate lyase activating enzyme
MGQNINSNTLADLFLTIQKRRGTNINLVTGTHFMPGIIKTIKIAKSRGLTLPIVWNSSGFESISSLKILEQWIDIYLPDMKTLDSKLSKLLFGTSKYPEVVTNALMFMASRKSIHYDADFLRRGVIIRHLVLPGLLESTRDVLQWFRKKLYGKVILSLMFQYSPMGKLNGLPKSLRRDVTADEYNQVCDYLEQFGIEEGFIQETSLENERNWIPDFSKKNPFPYSKNSLIKI